MLCSGVYMSVSAHNTERLRQICCHSQISDEDSKMFGAEQKSLEEIRTSMITAKKSELDVFREDLHLQESDRNSRGKEFAKLDRKENTNGIVHTRNRQSRKEQLQEMDRQIDEKKKSITRTKALITYFENILPKKSDDLPKECTICLDKITDMTVTGCGHIFCKLCIQQVAMVQGKCPNCRADISVGTLNVVKSKDDLKTRYDMERLVRQFGYVLCGCWVCGNASRGLMCCVVLCAFSS